MTRRGLFNLLPGAGLVQIIAPPPLATTSMELFKRDYVGAGAMGVTDGVNKTFTLSYAPNGKSRLQLFRNGLLQREGLDFALSGKVITYTTAPVAGDTLTADYYALFTV